MAAYQQYLPLQQLQELRRILLNRVKVSPVVLSQLLYTPQGEFLLHRLAQVIIAKSPQPEPEFAALRSALILASAESSGLTLLNVLRKYPTTSIHLDVVQTLEIATELDKLVNQTHRAIAVNPITSTTRRKYAYHFQRLQMANFLRLLMVGLFPPCCTSSIFGKAGLSQIKTPVMIVSSSDDTVAPALAEQILPFSWLANSQKYLVMLVGGTHFSTSPVGQFVIAQNSSHAKSEYRVRRGASSALAKTLPPSLSASERDRFGYAKPGRGLFISLITRLLLPL